MAEIVVSSNTFLLVNSMKVKPELHQYYMQELTGEKLKSQDQNHYRSSKRNPSSLSL